MPGFAWIRCASFKPFGPLALVQQALAAIIFAALCRFRGPALFHGLRPSSRLGAPFWPSGLTVRRSRPPTAAAELRALGGMKTLLFLAAALASFGGLAQNLPGEVARFIEERKKCEHFLGEPVEGRTAEQRERRDFVADSIDLYCSGTDKRLAALKRRYAGNARVMALLRPLEAKLE